MVLIETKTTCTKLIDILIAMSIITCHFLSSPPWWIRQYWLFSPLETFYFFGFWNIKIQFALLHPLSCCFLAIAPLLLLLMFLNFLSRELTSSQCVLHAQSYLFPWLLLLPAAEDNTQIHFSNTSFPSYACMQTPTEEFPVFNFLKLKNREI